MGIRSNLTVPQGVHNDFIYSTDYCPTATKDEILKCVNDFLR
jgi:hypothetical protein